MQLVKDMCTDHAMEACSRCDFNQGKPACEDPLQVYADLCLSMPEMTQCSRWNEMCADLSVDGEFPLCLSSNNAERMMNIVDYLYSLLDAYYYLHRAPIDANVFPYRLEGLRVV
jgi:hypothetical protein